MLENTEESTFTISEGVIEHIRLLVSINVHLTQLKLGGIFCQNAFFQEKYAQEKRLLCLTVIK